MTCEKFLVLGDSHCNAVIRALRKHSPERAFFGGQLPLGPNWQKKFHSNTDPLTFTVPDAQTKFELSVNEATGRSLNNILEVDVPILFSLSSIESIIYSKIWARWSPFESDQHYFLSRDVVEEIVDQHFSHIFEFLRLIGASGVHALNNISPLPRNNVDRRSDLHDVIRGILAEKHAEFGIPLVDVSEQTRDADSRGLKENLWANIEGDRIHANAGWGDCVAEAMMAKFPAR